MEKMKFTRKEVINAIMVINLPLSNQLLKEFEKNLDASMNDKLDAMQIRHCIEGGMARMNGDSYCPVWLSKEVVMKVCRLMGIPFHYTIKGNE